MPPQRGEIYEVNFERSEGARIKKTRPAVIIQNDIGNRYAPHTIVAAIRAAERKGFLPVFVRVPKSAAGLTKDSLIDCGHITAVAIEQLGRCLGTLPGELLHKLDAAEIVRWHREKAGTIEHVHRVMGLERSYGPSSLFIVDYAIHVCTDTSTPLAARLQTVCGRSRERVSGKAKPLNYDVSLFARLHSRRSVSLTPSGPRPRRAQPVARSSRPRSASSQPVETQLISSMNEFNLIPALAEAVADMGYSRPTPIQSQGIPVVLAGRDLIGCASTGTGKTAAFLLPILQRLQGRRDAGCRALILSPTRELALQIDEQVLALGYHVGLSAVAVVGGVEMGPQERALRGGCEIVVATPGRLLDHMRFKYVDFSAVEVVVIDEGDRMLDMGFLPDMHRILSSLPATRQTLLFSATFSPSIRQLARTILRDPVTVMVDRQQPADGIAHSTYRVAQERKSSLLASLLRPSEMRSVLVFVKRKVDADRLARAVARSGVGATSLHSDRSQPERTAALDAFRRGEYPVLVATDVAGRGLDISGISHVINFDVPRCSDDYIHRAGRTARAGATGHVITFIAPDEEALLGEIQAELGIVLPHVTLPESLLRVSAAPKRPPVGRRGRRHDRRAVAYGPFGRRPERAVPATPRTAPMSASASRARTLAGPRAPRRGLS